MSDLDKRFEEIDALVTRLKTAIPDPVEYDVAEHQATMDARTNRLTIDQALEKQIGLAYERRKEKVYDTSAWTGRTWDNKIILRRWPLWILWARRDWDTPDSEQSKTWGLMIGLNYGSMCWEIRWCWKYRSWALYRRTSMSLYGKLPYQERLATMMRDALRSAQFTIDEATRAWRKK